MYLYDINLLPYQEYYNRLLHDRKLKKIPDNEIIQVIADRLKLSPDKINLNSFKFGRETEKTKISGFINGEEAKYILTEMIAVSGAISLSVNSKERNKIKLMFKNWNEVWVDWPNSFLITEKIAKYYITNNQEYVTW